MMLTNFKLWEYKPMAYMKKPIATAALTLCISVAAVASDSVGSAQLDPQADALLKQMSDYMGGLKSFTADAYVFDDEIMADGFKLSVLGAGSLKVQRPNKLYITYKDSKQDREVFFDGSRMVVHGKGIGMFIELPLSAGANLDDALDSITETLGAELPARDLLGIDVYAPLIEPVEESAYLGAIDINGVSCRQLAFRTDEVDWQLWIEEGKRPLPCRYTITSKWVYGAPQHTVTFTNWQVNPKLPANDFEFTAVGSKPTTVETFIKSRKQPGGE